jgi:hypothetical protein
MPDCAGEWEWFLRPLYPMSDKYLRCLMMIGSVKVRRMCRELRMGGSRQVGFAGWSGEWLKL